MSYSPEEGNQGDIQHLLMALNTPLDPLIYTISFPTGSSSLPHDEEHYNSALGAEKPLLGDRNGPPTSYLKKTGSCPSIPGSTIGQKHSHGEYGVFEEICLVPDTAKSRLEPPVSPFSLSRLRRSASGWVSATHPWWPKTFERIHWPPLVILTGAVLATYSPLLFAPFIASGKSLFWSRFIVGSVSLVLGMSRVYLLRFTAVSHPIQGVLIGFGMMDVGRRILEAASEWHPCSARRS